MTNDTTQYNKAAPTTADTPFHSQTTLKRGDTFHNRHANTATANNTPHPGYRHQTNNASKSS